MSSKKFNKTAAPMRFRARSTRTLRALRSRVDRLDPEADYNLNTIIEDEDSEMDANWDMPPDPWVDGELKSINFDEDTMSDAEIELFVEGQFILTPPARVWRRWAIKMLMVLRLTTDSRLLSLLVPRASVLTKTEDDGVRIKKEECPHIPAHHRRGGNQYGFWIRCLKCNMRLDFIRKTADEIEEARSRMTIKKEKSIKNYKTEKLEDEPPADMVLPVPLAPLARCKPPPKTNPTPTAKKSGPLVAANPPARESDFDKMRWFMMEDRQDRAKQMDSLIEVVQGLAVAVNTASGAASSSGE